MSLKPSNLNSSSAPATGTLSFFEQYITLCVFLCIGVGIVLEQSFPEVATALDAMSFYQVSFPIAICLFFMMYPIMPRLV